MLHKLDGEPDLLRADQQAVPQGVLAAALVWSVRQRKRQRQTRSAGARQRRARHSILDEWVGEALRNWRATGHHTRRQGS